MLDQVVDFNEMIKSKGYDPIEVGIGINYGKAMLLTLGEQERMDPSVVSDVINSASRIEGLNKVFGTKLLVSGYVYDEIYDKSQLLIRQVDRVQVKRRKIGMAAL